jgi:hypothetical protein
MRIASPKKGGDCRWREQTVTLISKKLPLIAI